MTQKRKEKQKREKYATRRSTLWNIEISDYFLSINLLSKIFSKKKKTR